MSWRWRLLGLRLGLGIVASCASSLALNQSFLQSLLPGTWATFPYTSIALIFLTTLFLWSGNVRHIKALTILYLGALTPAVLSHSSVNWLRFLVHQPPNYSTLPLMETVALGLATLFCVFSIYLVTRLQEVLNHLIAHGAEAIDTRTYVLGSLRMGFTVAVGAFALTAAVFLVAFGITKGLDQVFRFIPWPVVTLGLVGASVMAILIFQAMFQRPSAKVD